jgi:hypothetical protein
LLAAGGYPSDLTTRNEAPGMALRAVPGTPKKKACRCYRQAEVKN